MRALARLAAALFVLAAAILPAAPAHAQGRERIMRFASDIAVQRNGELIVTETIKVLATGATITRGILRDFPTTYTARNGTRMEVAFDVRSVMRDGAPESYTTEPLANGMRVRIGSAQRTLTRGEHEYVISYRTTRQIGFFKDYDEIYWNVTGTGWTLPIDVAEATITLPDQLPFGQTAVYTGPQGAAGKAAEVVERQPGRIVFRTTAPLDAHSGLTVAAAFEKGVVIPPTEAERWENFARDNLPIALSAAALALLLGYLFYAWRAAGRDPASGTMVPLFSPPDGMTAAGVRYVDRMGMDGKTMTAAIVDIAVRGHAKLVDRKDDGMRLEPRKDGTAALPAPEADMEVKLFGKHPTAVQITSDNHGVFERARAALEAGLSKAYGEKLFHDNTRWSLGAVLIAIVLSVGVLIVTLAAWGGRDGGPAVIGAAVLLPAALVISALAARGFPENGAARSLLIFGAVVGCGGAVFAIGNILTDGVMRAVPAVLPLVLLPLAASAYGWMPAHTPEGRRIADQIEGFRHYLGVAERERLELLNPPKETAELFEKYLPYAIALDVENAWGRRFAGVLAAAALAPQVAGQSVTSWYQGQRDWSDWSRDPVGFASHLGDGLNDTIAAASVPPATTSSIGGDSGGSSSSYSGGSSGGGSSGGGGGGGGGSGW